MSRTTTRGVEIAVRSEYVAERSQPGRLYFFAYHITISNRGHEPVQLLSRHWVITDGSGKTEEVRGPGVVGQTPHLKPGESFQYTSACPLPTSVGTMHGSFQMITEDGDAFDARIDPFRLAVPGSLH